MNDRSNKRMLLILASALDILLGGAILLLYFGLLPVDISSWGIPRWVIGLVGGVWFAGALAILVYQLKKKDSLE
jgi:integral membrane sensor domain MASE1